MKNLGFGMMRLPVLNGIINLRRCFSKEDGKGTYDEDTIREAAKYYLYQDAGIRLKFQ